MVTAAALVIPRLTHEGCQHSCLRRDLLDTHLEQECSICGVKGIAVPQVDFVLRRRELVVASEYADLELI